MLYRKRELLAFLEEHDLVPRKGLSQNFLVDRNIIEKLIAHIEPGDRVLEIGPGPGAITELLLERGATVYAVEIDEKLAAALHRLPGDLHVIPGDILDLDLETLPTGLKVISNLPYQIASPILTRLLPHRDRFTRFTVLVQDEVARRYTANPGSKIYGSITVFLQFYSDVKLVAKVKRSAFWPVPNVDSAIIDITPKEPPPVDAEAFIAMVRRAFNQRRKMIRSTLGVDSDARPESLSLNCFLEIFDRLAE
jgi:16S rRNA (adenine1518-N6/adenine1519-N6)-dimethyltransferase